MTVAPFPFDRMVDHVRHVASQLRMKSGYSAQAASAYFETVNRAARYPFNRVAGVSPCVSLSRSANALPPPADKYRLILVYENLVEWISCAVARLKHSSVPANLAARNDLRLSASDFRCEGVNFRWREGFIRSAHRSSADNSSGDEWVSVNVERQFSCVICYAFRWIIILESTR